MIKNNICKRLNSAGKVNTLRKKILLSMVALLLLLGFASVFITRIILFKVLRTEFQHKGVAIARSLAANSLVEVLTQNTSRLKKLVENEKSLDSDIAYVFIVDSSGRILTHTFNKGFPIELAKVNSIEATKTFNIRTLDTQMGLIYDIAVPIALAEKNSLGQARLGIFQRGIQRTITTINLIFVCITFFIIIIGISLAYRVSFLITKPISRLVEATQLIQKGDFSTKIDVQTKDEIGLLAQAFNEMSSNLKLTIEEVKRLTMVEERNRIALDLHDGCAQDMANIIKRLELCEKLFKIDPAKAFEELAALKDNTRELLNRTRQVILNLKSSQNSDFNLLDKLSSYIKDYQGQSNINIKLDVSGSPNDIPSNKSESVFYIIAEALTNIRKHAQAKNVELSLRFNNNDGLIIEVKDDGKGFDINQALLDASSSAKFGLIGMRQRSDSLGATFNIDSKPHQGTKVCINVPL